MTRGRELLLWSVVFLGLSAGARAADPVDCEAWSLDGDTHLEVRIEEPLPGASIRAFSPDCPSATDIRGIASTVGLPPLFDIVITIDSSGSTGSCSGADVDGDGIVGFNIGMSGCSDPQDSILEAEVEASRNFVNDLDPANSRVAIVDFSDRFSSGCAGVFVRVHLTSDFALVLQALDDTANAGPCGATDYSAAVDELTNEYLNYGDPARTWQALFMSDGVPTAPVPPFNLEDGGDDSAALSATQIAADAGIVMDTFAVGRDASEFILRQMADMTGGKFHRLDTPGDILNELPGASLVGIESLTLRNLTTGQSVDGDIRSDGRFQKAIGIVEGRNDLRVHAVADDDQHTSLDCDTDFTMTCIEFLCPQNRVLECRDGGGSVSGFAASVDEAGVALTNDSPYDGSAPAGDGDASGSYPLGTTTVEFTASDTEAGERSCSRTVTVRDTQPPSIDCPDAQSAPADEDCNAALELSADAQDLCYGTQGVTVTDDAPPVFPLGTTVVTFSATDPTGLRSTCQTTVTVADQSAPTLTCNPVAPVEADDQCQACPSKGATSDDNCTPDSELQLSYDPVCPYGLGTTTVTLTARDAAGNAATCQWSIEVRDLTAPRVHCPADVTLTTEPDDADCRVPYDPQATADDNCDPSVALTDNAPSTFPLGTTTVTFRATDDSGNTDTCTQRVTVLDGTPPALDCPSDITLRTGPGDTDCAADTTLAASATDNCDTQLTVTDDAPDHFPVGTTVVTFSATDDAGNSATCTTTVTVLDTTPPALQCPPDQTVQTGPLDQDCMVPVQLPASAVDNCEGSVVATSDAPAEFGLGTTVVTFTAEDSRGNRATCQTSVTVEDDTDPSVTCPPDRTLETGPGDTDCRVEDVLDADATDNCDDDPDVTSDAPPAFPLGTTVVTFTATDDSGNFDSCTTRVTVIDTTPPVLDCAATISLETGPDDTDCMVPFVPAATASDNCSAAGDLTLTSDAPAEFPLGTTIVTFTATDEAGNSSTCQTAVTVEDTTPPTVVCEASVTLPTGPDDTDCLVPYVPVASATDNCSAAGDITIVSDAPAQFPLGTTIVTFTATDEAGNSSTCQTAVTVVDTTPPALVCEAAVTLETGPDDTDCLVPFTPVAAATDNCSASGDITIVSDAPPEFPLGTTIVTFTATDEAGNMSICRTAVTVVDTTAPRLELLLGEDICLWPPDHRFYCWEDDKIFRASDNCDTAAFTALECLPNPPGNGSSNQPVDSTGDGAFVPDCVVATDGHSGVCVRSERQGNGAPGPHGERVYRIGVTVRDASGNVSTAEFTVTVGHDSKEHPDCIFMDPGTGYGAEDKTLPPIYPQFRLPGSPGQRKNDARH